MSIALKLPPPALLAIAAVAMWQLDRWLPAARVGIPGRPLIAIALVATAAVLMAAAIMLFFDRKTTINPMTPARSSQLLTEGVFAISRNPIYLADLALLLAWAVWLSNVATVVVPVLFVVYLNRFQIGPEEQALQTLFGDAYSSYRARVRRWI